MKAGKLILALALAAGAVAAYWYFPDPLGDQVAAAQKANAQKDSGQANTAAPAQPMAP